MHLYTVTWTIDVEADDPVDAARQALAVHPHHEPTSWATVVTVADSLSEHLVDLDPEGTGSEQAPPTCTRTAPDDGTGRQA